MNSINSSSSLPTFSLATAPLPIKSFHNHIDETIYRWSQTQPLIFAEAADLFNNNNKTLAQIDSTSCVVTMTGLSVLFSGVEKADKIRLILSTLLKPTLECETPTRSTFEYSIRNLFVGDSICQIGDILNSKNIEPELSSKVMSTSDLFHAHFTDEVNKNDINKPIRNNLINAMISYDFNKTTFDFFHKELTSEPLDKNPDIFYFYYVGIYSPGEWGLPAVNGLDMAHHCFVIQQSWSSTLNENVYRLYQSWLHKNTLSQDMDQRKFSLNQSDWYWKKEEMKDFLSNLKYILCHSNISPIEQGIYRTNAFGYTDNNEYPLVYLLDNHEIGGVSFRYIKDTITKEKLCSHAADFSECFVHN